MGRERGASCRPGLGDISSQPAGFWCGTPLCGNSKLESGLPSHVEGIFVKIIW